MAWPRPPPPLRSPLPVSSPLPLPLLPSPQLSPLLLLLLLLSSAVPHAQGGVIEFRDGARVRCAAGSACVPVLSCVEITSLRQLRKEPICRFSGLEPFICCPRPADGDEEGPGETKPESAKEPVNGPVKKQCFFDQRPAWEKFVQPKQGVSSKRKQGKLMPKRPQTQSKTTQDSASEQKTSPKSRLGELAPVTRISDRTASDWHLVQETCGTVPATRGPGRRRRGADAQPAAVEEVIPPPTVDRHRTMVVRGRGVRRAGRWPWMAAVGRQPPGDSSPSWFCGGVLLSPRFVVTAAHCVTGDDAAPLRVRLGELRLSAAAEAADAAHAARRVARVCRHPDFAAAHNDIALLELAEPVPFSDTVRPVCLPPPGAEFPGQPVTLTGWGRLAFAGATADVLQEARLRVQDPAACEAAYSALFPRDFPGGFRDTKLCAVGVTSAEVDACQGDSGGPLVHRRPGSDDRYQLVGLVATGIGCGNPRFPGIYTRVASYVPWIESMVFPGSARNRNRGRGQKMTSELSLRPL